MFLEKLNAQISFTVIDSKYSGKSVFCFILLVITFSFLAKSNFIKYIYNHAVINLILTFWYYSTLTDNEDSFNCPTITIKNKLNNDNIGSTATVLQVPHKYLNNCLRLH